MISGACLSYKLQRKFCSASQKVYKQQDEPGASYRWGQTEA